MNKNRLASLKEQMASLKQMDDKDIDFSDIPEISDFAGFERGKFQRPIKKPVLMLARSRCVGLDSKSPSDCQSAINAALRQYIHDQR